MFTNAQNLRKFYKIFQLKKICGEICKMRKFIRIMKSTKIKIDRIEKFTIANLQFNRWKNQ